MRSVDRKIVNDDITTFIAAVSLMFGSYYCFNIHYPTDLASALEFLQRYVETPREVHFTVPHKSEYNPYISAIILVYLPTGKY